MLLFNIYFTNYNTSIAEKFADAGFNICEQITTNNDHLIFDVAWFSTINDLEVLKNNPVRLVITENEQLTMPSQYYKSICNISDCKFFVYSFSERPFVLQKDWQIFYQEFLHEDSFVLKIFADHVYRYLLTERIQEVEDWCGHMSSVVGKF